MEIRRTNQWQIFAISGIASAIIPLIILLVIWFWARGAISSAIESVLPSGAAKTVTNLVFGVLAIYFLVKFLGKRA